MCKTKPHRTPETRRQRGFSLLEILVALTIAASTCGVAFSLIGQSSRTATVNQNYQTALLLAESKMAEVSANPQRWLGENQGHYSAPFFWQTTVTSYQDEQTTGVRHPFSLYRIDVQVGWIAGVKPAISLSTLRLGSQR